LGSRPARLQTGDGQDGVEGLEQRVRLVQRHAQGVHARRSPRLGVDKRDLHLGLHPVQRGPQVMGDGVPGMADRGHRALQPVQHPVQPLGQFVQLVAGMADRNAGLQVALLHRRHHAVQTGHGAFNAPADPQPAADAQHKHHDHRPPQGLGQPRQIGLDVADVLADE